MRLGRLSGVAAPLLLSSNIAYAFRSALSLFAI